MTGYRIGDIARLSGLSVDTLRYYEKTGVLPPVARTTGGTRLYTERDLGRVRFIRRAQAMGFSLAEIGQLLRMRDNPAGARAEVRTLTRERLAEVESRLEQLEFLRDELRLLVNLCTDADGGPCPIIEGLEEGLERANRD
ncbi:MAG: heavy metal-responsive transcriptional regulator [Gammaproteobacteria bacterium]|nr:heavy metal-responsive transcriptional regulator [Gemmatimonadota bacterium]NIR82446.1 heavy metal-responsive transcriptional regulator [Gammaproteobacteria bacterium]NIU03582.1 heavy metal-responsive transcriptional regulator [Gammaproteobacteria bacterium]NIX84856.1 MerR family transcriptional regulator [Gammaproteobacteria bacterium]